VDVPTKSHEIQDAARRLSGRRFERNGLKREIRHGVFMESAKAGGLTQSPGRLAVDAYIARWFFAGR